MEKLFKMNRNYKIKRHNRSRSKIKKNRQSVQANPLNLKLN